MARRGHPALLFGQLVALALLGIVAPARGAQPTAGAVPARLTLRAHTVVAAPQVTLGDVVLESLPPLWAALPLGFAPAPGTTSELTAGLVRRVLALDAPAAPPSLVGAPACRVSRTAGAQASDEGAVATAILRELQGLPPPELAIGQRFRLLSAPRARAVHGEVTVRLLGAVPTVGTGSVPLELRDASGGTERVQAVVARSLEANGWVICADVAAGATLSPSDVRPDTVWVETAQAWGNLLRQSPAEAGYRSVRALSPRTPILKTDLRRAPIVLRGTSVRWIVRRGALLITVHATARSEGAAGDEVWVESPYDRALHRLTVVGPGMVGDAPPADRERAPTRGAKDLAEEVAHSLSKELP